MQVALNLKLMQYLPNVRNAYLVLLFLDVAKGGKCLPIAEKSFFVQAIRVLPHDLLQYATPSRTEASFGNSADGDVAFHGTNKVIGIVLAYVRLTAAVGVASEDLCGFAFVAL